MKYNTKTKNKSFVNQWHRLQSEDYENNIFMLATHDHDLIDIDIGSDDFLSMKETEREILVTKIINECKNNIWYFFREIVRIPQSFGIYKNNSSECTRFELTEELLEILYLYENGISVLCNKSDGNIKRGYTTLITLLELYDAFIHRDYTTYNSLILVFTDYSKIKYSDRVSRLNLINTNIPYISQYTIDNIKEVYSEYRNDINEISNLINASDKVFIHHEKNEINLEDYSYLLHGINTFDKSKYTPIYMVTENKRFTSMVDCNTPYKVIFNQKNYNTERFIYDDKNIQKYQSKIFVY